MLNILNVAQSGLSTAQTQVENVMNNLANQNTEGYKKRTALVSEIEHSDSRLTGRGVQVDEVTRTTNMYMYQNLIKADSNLSYTNQLDSMLGDIESIFYETDTSGFSADLNRYFDSIENLKTSPQNEVYKNDISNNASVIVSTLQTLYSNIEDREDSTLANIKENVDEINSILNEIGNLSQQILETTGGTPNDLLDRRDLLEKELSEYIDVEISREENYQLTIAGVTAVRFDTNVHNVTLVENYTPQKDVYAAVNADGTTLIPIEDSIIPTTWTDAGVAEFQEISITGEYNDGSGDAVATAKTVKFLGTAVPTTMGASATDIATDIFNDKVNIIAKWNDNNPDNRIEDITVSGTTITIEYNELDGDVQAIDNAESNGVNFTGSIERLVTASPFVTDKGSVDSLTYTLNNEFSLKVTRGEILLDAAGNEVDLDGDGLLAGDDIVTEDNVLKAMIYKINESQDIGNVVHAYNGQYELAEDGSKILTNDPRHSDYDPLDPNKDRYLVIEAVVDGDEGSFTGEFLVNDSNEKNFQEKNDFLSEDGIDDIHLEIYEKEITLSSGSVKAMLDNVKTDSGANIFDSYKEQLDNFAKTLSNLTGAYIENADLSYVYGTDNIALSSDEDKKVVLDLFSGADVKSLKFNAASLNIMTQEKLDYLSTLQWKEDIDFDGTGLNDQSFSEFYQTLRVNIADNKENVAFTQGSQAAISESLQSAYDKITMVDSDEEMIELIKFQSAYTANAKMITAVDEMLQTILNM